MSVNLVELLWTVICLSGVFTSAVLVIGAWSELSAFNHDPKVGDGTHIARRLILGGSVRRELFRLAVQLLLLGVVVPSLFRPGDVTFVIDFSTAESIQRTLNSLALVALIAVPVFMLINSLLDARQNRRVRDVTEALSTQSIAEVAAASTQRIEAALAAIGKKADAAYHAANDVNLKISDLNERLLEEAEARKAADT